MRDACLVKAEYRPKVKVMSSTANPTTCTLLVCYPPKTRLSRLVSS